MSALAEAHLTELMDAAGELIEQLQYALQAHHGDDVTAGRDCAICREWSGAIAQRFEQLDAVLQRIGIGS